MTRPAFILRCGLAAGLTIFWLGAASGQVLSREPPSGALSPGTRVLVDDGTCPTGQIKEVIGGNDTRGTRRKRRCIPR
jgi:hypothetical protein